MYLRTNNQLAATEVAAAVATVLRGFIAMTPVKKENQQSASILGSSGRPGGAICNTVWQAVKHDIIKPKLCSKSMS